MTIRSLESLRIWQEPDLRNKLSWYRQVSSNRMPAKFRIAAQIPVEVPLDATEEVLWRELEEKTPRFQDLRDRICSGIADFPTAPRLQPNLVDLCRELTQRMLAHCDFCRWNCQVDRRQAKKLGTCRLSADSRVSCYFHHHGEELIYRGRRGSGTIFFTSCNMRCAFCQNGDISTDKDNGKAVSPRTLATMAWLLGKEGCHNINWVGGEVVIHLHTILEAISLLEELNPTDVDLQEAKPMKADFFVHSDGNPGAASYQGKFNAPMLWNSNFFMSSTALRVLRLLMDVWLPDLKFGPGRCAINLSRTPWYWETVTGNIKAIYEWGEDLTIRHLVMPNHVECCTRPILSWIAENVPEVPVNIMDQYYPDNYCDPYGTKYDPKYQELARQPTSKEVLQAFRYAKELELNFESISYEKNTTGLHL